MSKKEKKPSESTLTKQAIARKYNTAPIIVSCSDGYAAVDKEHIQIFKYNKAINDVSSISTYHFSDFDIVIIDRFAIKAIMNFKGLHTQFEFIPTEELKEIENLLRTNTHLHVEKLERKWHNKILGFRSQNKFKMIFASLVYLFIVISTINGCVDKKIEQQKIASVAQKKKAKEDEIKALKTEDGQPINVPLYTKYNVKYKSGEPTDIETLKDEAVMKHFERMAEKYNMSVPEYISKEHEIVAANVAKAKEEAEKQKEAKNSKNNQASAESKDGSYSKKAIQSTLNRLNKNIDSWKAMNGGQLNKNDITVINDDLKFVLEHVQDLESDVGTNSQIEQFKRAINSHINAFEIGSANDVSKLIIQANAL
ncbi:hypothetical protein [Bacillus cereus]|uniref:hypothetical protein n=1 Tax=Bacillus cereus TaxID=1396 RepID=UPI0036305896